MGFDSKKPKTPLEAQQREQPQRGAASAFCMSHVILPPISYR